MAGFVRPELVLLESAVSSDAPVPVLPAETTTTMPACQACSAA